MKEFTYILEMPKKYVYRTYRHKTFPVRLYMCTPMSTVGKLTVFICHRAKSFYLSVTVASKSDAA